MNIEKRIRDTVIRYLDEKSLQPFPPEALQIQDTRREFSGDITLVVFPLVKILRKSPEETGKIIGGYLRDKIDWIADFNTVKGFLNLEFSKGFWVKVLDELSDSAVPGSKEPMENQPVYMVEYSSPNTNKPLHLGHIRNNLIGFALSRILGSRGYQVIKTNIVNDRGIHICKTMLAWQKWGKGITPEKAGKKGDHLVGDLYVMFEQHYKKEIESLVSGGMKEDEARRKAPLMQEAQEMLRKWEAGDPDTIALWKQMNNWVYDGFGETYAELGVSFDKIYYESETYKLGKEIVLDALRKGYVYRREDNSVWADLTGEGLDEKLLLRSDGTAVYITQDLGTARIRYDDYHFDRHIYVVGNEQNYHFQVLKIILKKIGYPWADNLYHLSYGMVELPEGKMKSREGTVVDADDLIGEMKKTAREMGDELGKLDTLGDDEKKDVFRKVGLGALKYFILKVDPKKNMTFNPRESIDFNGNTGPFIQYTYARIRSVMRKAEERGIPVDEKPGSGYLPNDKEILLMRSLMRFPGVLDDAAEMMNPSLLANYVYEIVKAFNQFYHDYSILNEPAVEARRFRIALAVQVEKTIYRAMYLLGIDLPERM
ncbi:MAG: arginine--tRNA ligase [Chlorobi bacterium]|nr:arginine--tRNA ligase [Chlorobiota bacterium]